MRSKICYSQNRYIVKPIENLSLYFHVPILIKAIDIQWYKYFSFCLVLVPVQFYFLAGASPAPPWEIPECRGEAHDQQHQQHQHQLLNPFLSADPGWGFLHRRHFFVKAGLDSCWLAKSFCKATSTMKQDNTFESSPSRIRGMIIKGNYKAWLYFIEEEGNNI